MVAGYYLEFDYMPFQPVVHDKVNIPKFAVGNLAAHM